MEPGELGVLGMLAPLDVGMELSQEQEPVTAQRLPMVDPPAQLHQQVAQTPKPAIPIVVQVSRSGTRYQTNY